MSKSGADLKVYDRKRKYKTPSYWFGVEWIALNDEPDCLDSTEVAGLVSTCLLADLFGCPANIVAADIVSKRLPLLRKRHDENAA